MYPVFSAGNLRDARRYADRYILIPERGAYVPAFQDTINKIRRQFFQKNPSGASFYDNSKLWHAEAYYNFDKIKVGGSDRRRQFPAVQSSSPTQLFLMKLPPMRTNPKRIFINQFGVYTQIAKTIS